MIEVLSSDGPAPDAGVVRAQSFDEFWQACSVVQREDPQAWQVLYLNVFQKLTLEEVSQKVGGVVRTITRRKPRALELLQNELQARGIEMMDLA